MKMYKAEIIEPIDSFYFFSSVTHPFSGVYYRLFFFCYYFINIYFFSTFNMIIYTCEFNLLYEF